MANNCKQSDLSIQDSPPAAEVVVPIFVTSYDSSSSDYGPSNYHYDYFTTFEEAEKNKKSPYGTIDRRKGVLDEDGFHVTLMETTKTKLSDAVIREKAKNAAIAEQNRRQKLAEDARKRLTEEQLTYLLHPEKIKVPIPY